MLTFGSCALPDEVRIGWTRCVVREYIPPPRRCFKCNKFGHGSKSCRQDKGTCVTCGQEQHGGDFQREPKCSNCGEQHTAASKECFYYKLEVEAVTLETRETISYIEAKREATQASISPKHSYAKNAFTTSSKWKLLRYKLEKRVVTQRQSESNSSCHQVKAHLRRDGVSSTAKKPPHTKARSEKIDRNTSNENKPNTKASTQPHNSLC